MEKEDDDTGSGLYDYDTIESDRLRRLAGAPCPECGSYSNATGKMFKPRFLGLWFIEYWCPKDEDFSIASPYNKDLTLEIARKHGR